MRLATVPLHLAKYTLQAIERADIKSRTVHGTLKAIDCWRY